MQKYKNKVRINLGETTIVYMLICVILLTLISLLFIFDHYENADETRRLENLAYQGRQDEIKNEAEQAAIREREENDSFYQRLADGLDVRILIVGDSIGNGRGASAPEYTWAELLKDDLEREYGISADVVNRSMNDSTAYSGYVNVMLEDENEPYHAVLVCFGEDDRQNNFDVYYEGIIRAAQKKYPRAAILSIMENTSRRYTDNMQVIHRLSELYGIPCADTISAADYRENQYEGILNDAGYPTDEGQRLYADTLMALIRTNAEQYTDLPDALTEMADEDTAWFGTLNAIPSDAFARQGNTFVYEVHGEAVSGKIIGIEYDYVTGNNNCLIYFDSTGQIAGQAIFNNTLQYDSGDQLNGSNPHHIRVMNEWISDYGTVSGRIVSASNQIRVVFPENANGTVQADSFRRLLISDAE